MILEPRIVREIGQSVREAADGVIHDYSVERIVDEPHITDRLLGAIGERLRGGRADGVIWSAKTLRPGQGKANEEQRHGADFLGVLEISLPELAVKKGFLIQAKRAEPDVPLPSGEWKRMVGQCKTMLEVTPAAFVAIYSRSAGVRFVPAIEIVGSTTEDLFAHYSRDIGSFFELFVECFIGDRALNSAHIAVLDELRSALPTLELIISSAR
jgi:hypothetical protein